MPYVKSISIRTTVEKSLAYILDPDKTDELMYTTSQNCLSDPRDAYLGMKTVYEYFSGKKFNEPIPDKGKGSVKAIHYIQSFDPKDNISPELAHRIAKAFARKTFGDDCQIVIATHVDKKHVHNHFIINTYSIKGEKFNANKKTLDRIKEYSDRVCLAFGIQPFDKRKAKGRSASYGEWVNRKRGTSWKQKMRLDIDRLILKSKNIDDMLYEMELLGYTVKKGKYISIKAEGQKRFIRTKTLGEDYTPESLVSRIKWKDVGADITLSGELSEIQHTYSDVINAVRALALEGRKIPRKRDNTAPYSPDNDMDVYKLSVQLTVINRDKITSIGDLRGRIERLKEEYERARRELNDLNARYDKLESLAETVEKFEKLSGKGGLSIAEKLQLRIYEQALKNNNITTSEEREGLQKLYREVEKKKYELEKMFKECRNAYETYSEIADTYDKLSKGDYISNLIQEKLRQDEEKKKAADKRSRR